MVEARHRRLAVLRRVPDQDRPRDPARGPRPRRVARSTSSAACASSVRFVRAFRPLIAAPPMGAPEPTGARYRSIPVPALASAPNRFGRIAMTALPGPRGRAAVRAVRDVLATPMITIEALAEQYGRTFSIGLGPTSI